MPEALAETSPPPVTPPGTRSSGRRAPPWQALVPGVFVLLWATGFFIGKLGLPYAPPFTILLLRFAAAGVALAAIGLALGVRWPRDLRQAGHLAVVGVLLHTVYLGGCYAAMAAGLPAGVTALVVGLQPLLTAAVVGPLLGERVSRRQWLGLVIGFLGVGLVLWDKLALVGLESWGLVFAAGGLVGITTATLYQKRFCGSVDLIAGVTIQYVAATLATLPVVGVLGFGPVHWTGTFVFSLVWLTLVLSLGAISLLLWLIRRGAASKVASLFYLTPPMAALGGYLLLGETLALPALAGMGLAAAGVALVNRR